MEVEEIVIKDYFCPVCDLQDSKENIRKHAMIHFEEEIKAIVNDQTFGDACPNCPYELDLNHLALDHGWIDKLLNDQITIGEKRLVHFSSPISAVPAKILETRKRRPSVDLTQVKRVKENFKCILCGNVIPEPDKGHKNAIDHFATHVWLQMQKLPPQVRYRKLLYIFLSINSIFRKL